jgi:uncharacterized membrane protein
LGEERVGVGGGGGHQVHRAEAAGVVEGDAGAIVHIKDDMIVLFGRGVVVVPFAQRFALIGGRRDEHPARHAEMDEERFAGGEIGEDVFRAAAQERTRAPVSRSAMRGGKGQRRSGRLTWRG